MTSTTLDYDFSIDHYSKLDKPYILSRGKKAIQSFLTYIEAFRHYAYQIQVMNETFIIKARKAFESSSKKEELRKSHLMYNQVSKKIKNELIKEVSKTTPRMKVAAPPSWRESTQGKDISFETSKLDKKARKKAKEKEDMLDAMAFAAGILIIAIPIALLVALILKGN